MRRIFTNKPEPVIYFRFHLGALMYIGETQDLKQGRPFRDGDKDAHKESHNRFRKIVHKNVFAQQILKRLKRWKTNFMIATLGNMIKSLQ